MEVLSCRKLCSCWTCLIGGHEDKRWCNPLQFILLVLFICKYAVIEINLCCRVFCQRVNLCNSLVWCCFLSGKLRLIYQEALQSEVNARMLIETFPRKVIFISHLKRLLHFLNGFLFSGRRILQLLVLLCSTSKIMYVSGWSFSKAEEHCTTHLILPVFSHQNSSPLSCTWGDVVPLISNVIGRWSDTFSKVHTHVVSHWTQTVLGPWFH